MQLPKHPKPEENIGLDGVKGYIKSGRMVLQEKKSK